MTELERIEAEIAHLPLPELLEWQCSLEHGLSRAFGVTSWTRTVLDAVRYELKWRALRAAECSAPFTAPK